MTTDANATDPTVSDPGTAGGGGCGGGGCGCGAGGCGGNARVPELDARPIDPQIRQAAIFGVLIGLPPGSAATVLTDESPELVMTLIEGQFAGQYDIACEQQGEDLWRTTFTRR